MTGRYHSLPQTLERPLPGLRLYSLTPSPELWYSTACQPRTEDQDPRERLRRGPRRRREVFRAALWSLAAAFFAAIGIIHAYDLTPGGVATRFSLFAAPEFTISYLLLFVLFLAVAWWERK